jgi:hypothetical protein
MSPIEVMKITFVPLELYSPAGDVKGVAELGGGLAVALGLVDGLMVGLGDAVLF